MGWPAKYPPEFQREAVEFVLGSGRSINEVAPSLGSKRGRWAAG
jgi:transposase-like protein